MDRYHSQEPTSLAVVACGVEVRAGGRRRLVVGVNHELHKRVNGGPTKTIAGLLKGCAEQNALGAVAAMGLPYSAVAKIIIYGRRDGDSAATGIGMGLPAPSPVLMPCAHCCACADQVAHSREERCASARALPFIVATPYRPDSAHPALLTSQPKKFGKEAVQYFVVTV